MAVALNPSASLYSAQLKSTSTTVAPKNDSSHNNSNANSNSFAANTDKGTKTGASIDTSASTTPSRRSSRVAAMSPTSTNFPQLLSSDSESITSTFPSSPTRNRRRSSAVPSANDLPFSSISLNASDSLKASDLLAQPTRQHPTLLSTANTGITPSVKNVKLDDPVWNQKGAGADAVVFSQPIYPAVQAAAVETPLRRMDEALTVKELEEIAQDTPLGTFIHRTTHQNVPHQRFPIELLFPNESHSAGNRPTSIPSNSTQSSIQLNSAQPPITSATSLGPLPSRSSSTAVSGPTANATKQAFFRPAAPPMAHASFASTTVPSTPQKQVYESFEGAADVTPRVIRVLRSRAIVDSPVAAASALTPRRRSRLAAETSRKSQFALAEVMAPIAAGIAAKLSILSTAAKRVAVQALSLARSRLAVYHTLFLTVALAAALFASSAWLYLQVDFEPLSEIIGQPSSPPSTAPSVLSRAEIEALMQEALGSVQDSLLGSIDARFEAEKKDFSAALTKAHSQPAAPGTANQLSSLNSALNELRSTLKSTQASVEKSHSESSGTKRQLSLLMQQLQGLESRLKDLETKQKQEQQQSQSQKNPDTEAEAEMPLSKLIDLTGSARVNRKLSTSPYKTRSMKGRDVSAALDDSLAPGSCFAFAKNRGKLALTLARQTRLQYVVLEHPLAPSQVPTRTSAPADWELWSFASEANELDSPLLLGKGAFKADGPQRQVFPLVSNTPVQFVQLRVRSNQGNPDFTCIYRLRLY